MFYKYIVMNRPFYDNYMYGTVDFSTSLPNFAYFWRQINGNIDVFWLIRAILILRKTFSGSSENQSFAVIVKLYIYLCMRLLYCNVILVSKLKNTYGSRLNVAEWQRNRMEICRQ